MDIKRLLHKLVEKYLDSTLSEYCEYWGNIYGQWISPSTMCRELKRLGLTKKNPLRSSQATTDRVQKLRGEYWEKVNNVEPENLVFIDEMGFLLGLTRNYARSPHGTRVCDLKPFYVRRKITAIGAISIKKQVALMTINDSRDGKAFEVFIEKFLMPEHARGSGSSNG